MNLHSDSINHSIKHDEMDIKAVRLGFNPRSGDWIEKQPTELFLKGPIPLKWLSVAASLPGKSINVALAINWLDGMNRGKPFKLTKKALGLFNISKDAANDALNRLAAAGLISLDRRPGQRPTIRVLGAERTSPKLD